MNFIKLIKNVSSPRKNVTKIHKFAMFQNYDR